MRGELGICVLIRNSKKKNDTTATESEFFDAVRCPALSLDAWMVACTWSACISTTIRSKTSHIVLLRLRIVIFDKNFLTCPQFAQRTHRDKYLVVNNDLLESTIWASMVVDELSLVSNTAGSMTAFSEGTAACTSGKIPWRSNDSFIRRRCSP